MALTRILALAWLSLWLGCSSGSHSTKTPAKHPADGGTSTDSGPVQIPFEPFPPSAYGAKVKNLMVGQALSADELQSLTDDPSSLGGLVEGWMAQPEWRQRLLVFFKQAFQQTQVSIRDYADVLNFRPGVLSPTPFLRDSEEVFPRTALQLMDEGKPFTEVVTTRRFMLTPPLMSMLAYMDTTPQDDNGMTERTGWWVLDKYKKFVFVADTQQVPIEETLDPSSPNFMHWYDPMPPGADAMPQCAEPRSFAQGRASLLALGEFIFGSHGPMCGSTTSQWSDADWNDWRMVTVRQPFDATEAKTEFWNIAAIKAAKELVLDTPRVGFMTTPAFFANWPTNNSNQARVTANQTMIVALGIAFDDRGVTVPVTQTADDAAHAAPGTVCYGCHQTLDPLRDFFRESYTYYYGHRVDLAAANIPEMGSFSVGGSPPVMGTGVVDLAAAIASQPALAAAWAQKLCAFANSDSCAPDDPELARVAQAFADSNYDFKVLVHEMFSSPLVTFATKTATAAAHGTVISIARHDTLCIALSNRLGLGDACGLYGAASDKKTASLAGAIPGDGYARGAEEPVLPHDPDLFFVSATENICVGLAKKAVDGGAMSPFKSKDKDAAIRGMVGSVMGVPPNDARSDKLIDILERHYQAAIDAQQVPTDALRSTFVLACSSPLATSLGL